MNYKLKKQAISTIISMETKKFNINLINNKPIKIKISSILFNELNNSWIYSLKIPFLNFDILAYGQLTNYSVINLWDSISYPIWSGEYTINIYDIADESIPNTGNCIINFIFYYE